MAKLVSMEAINMPACGLDIHKDMIEACVIDANGNKHQKTFNTMRKTLYTLKNWILSLGCMHVLMESTGVFWIPIYEILEEVVGMNVGVGNARHMKQVPGRPKTDKADSNWIARLCAFGLVLKSFVVGKPFRELREFTRYHKKLVEERVRHIGRIEKLLQMNGFKLSSVLSDITGVSGLRLLKKLRDTGIVTLSDVIQLVDGRVKRSHAEIESAINGQMKLTSRLLLGRMLSKLESCDKEIAEIYELMLQSAKPYESEIRLIDSIPGLGELSALYIVAEIGTDLSSFKSANHLTAWAGLAPKDHESAGKLRASKTKKANIYVKSVLVECAWAAVRARDTRLSNWYWANVKRLGNKKAIIAVARKLLVYIYAMLNSGQLYDDSLDASDTLKRKAQKLESAQKIVEHHSNTAQTEEQSSDICGSNVVPCESGAALTLGCYAESPRQEANGCETKPTPALKPHCELAAPKQKRGRPRKSEKLDQESSSLAA